MPGLLQNHIAVVTGAGSGIGRAIAQGFAREGATVAALDIDGATAAKAATEINGAGGVAHAFTLDVRDRTACRDVAAKIASEVGQVSILVNNAGINKPTDFDQISAADWDDILAANLKGPFLVSQTFLPLLKSAGGGAMVHIGSVSGQYGGPRTAHYAASKAGLISLSQVIARFGAQYNVRSNVVAAGMIASEMAAGGLQAAAVQKAAENILLRRMGRPEEVADAVVFLASEASSYVTAQTLNVNGGLYF